jgi:hypothetical protein
MASPYASATQTEGSAIGEFVFGAGIVGIDDLEAQDVAIKTNRAGRILHSAGLLPRARTSAAESRRRRSS